MGGTDSKAAVDAAVAQLDSAVTDLRRAYGDTIGVRRLTSDVRRIAEDLAELGDPLPGHVPPPAAPLETIPDDPYDRSMWTDAEDEGLGAPDRHAP